jgi:hypothetical protein
MEPERFDDVEFQVLEEPVQRGPRRSTRWGLAVVAAALSAGALAAGASALTSSGGEPPTPVAKPLLHSSRTDAALPGGHLCERVPAASVSGAVRD